MDYTTISNEELEHEVQQKNGDAMCELGLRYLNGTHGIIANQTRGYRLLHKAEKMEVQKAYQALGDMYRYGIFFAPKRELAEKYYRAAGVDWNSPTLLQGEEQTPPPSVNPVLSDQMMELLPPVLPPSGKGGAVVLEQTFQDTLQQAGSLRDQQNYAMARQKCQEVLRLADSVCQGTSSYCGAKKAEWWISEAYFLLGYICFNEQNYKEMEQYLGQKDVFEQHPWGRYLVAAAHQMTQAPQAALQTDLQNLLQINKEQLPIADKGDICAMIADLIIAGYGSMLGIGADKAAVYYKEAMDCGNEYAKQCYYNLNR